MSIAKYEPLFTIEELLSENLEQPENVNNVSEKSASEIVSEEPVITRKTRKDVEHNGMELLCALLFLYSDISTENIHTYLHTIRTVGEPRLWCENLAQFTYDLLSKSHIIANYIHNFSFPSTFSQDEIECVILTGKHIKHTGIIELNKGIGRKSAKADLYLQLKNGTYAGVSVKQSSNATKTNFSVHKFFNKELDNELSQFRKKYLQDAGFPKHDSAKRNDVNKLFYPKNKDTITHTGGDGDGEPQEKSEENQSDAFIENPYFVRLMKEIKNHADIIIPGLIEPMFCKDLPYKMYEYDGNQLVCLNYNDVINTPISFEHHLPYYYDTKGKLRECAKLFYQLIVHEKKYRVEVRWKGNIHNASPQFQVIAE